MITMESVGKPEEPIFSYVPDDWYDVDKGYCESIDYSSLRVISPEVSRKLWEHCDKQLLWEMRYFLHCVQKRYEVQYGCCPASDYKVDDPVLHPDVEFFSQWATADDRLRYICEYIVVNKNNTLIDKIGNGLASHFYGARNVHTALTGETDPMKAQLDFNRLADEQLDFKRTNRVGDYTMFLREFLEKQKKKKIRFWGTTELHTSIQTAGRRRVNELYLGDRLHENKGTTANVAEWIASWRNSGLLQRMIDNSGLKSMCEILGSEWGIGDYYKFHGGSDLSFCPELNAYLDERYVIPGPGASKTLKDLYPNLSKREVSYQDRVIWMRENQKRLLGLPKIDKFFHSLNVYGYEIFPEKIDEIKTTQMEVGHCQFSIYRDLKANPEKIKKRKIARNADELSCSLDSAAESNSFKIFK